jgi:hypothetical protein
MKNLGADKLRNVFPKNPTQTVYSRFLKSPESDLETQFSKTERAFRRRFIETKLKTIYSEYLEPLGRTLR